MLIVGPSNGEEKQMQSEKATFAGGCFWCMQDPFDQWLKKGVLATEVGYTGGSPSNPTYQEICTGKTGHAEAIQITFDPGQITYVELLNIFWKNIDPTTVNQQFNDHGSQYRTAIFYHNSEQKKQALESKEKLEKSGKFTSRIVTEITPASIFYVAEEYHQKYYEKNTFSYKLYKKGSGRERFIHQTWDEKNTVFDE
jgi:methionine-S-sulfoxide reductase